MNRIGVRKMKSKVWLLPCLLSLFVTSVALGQPDVPKQKKMKGDAPARAEQKPHAPSGPALAEQNGDVARVVFELPTGGTDHLGISWFKENDALASHPEKWPDMKSRYVTLHCRNAAVRDILIRNRPLLKDGKRYKVVSIEWTH